MATPIWESISRQDADIGDLSNHFLCAKFWKPLEANWPILMLAVEEVEGGIAMQVKMRFSPDDRDMWVVLGNEAIPAELENEGHDLLILGAKRLKAGNVNNRNSS